MVRNREELLRVASKNAGQLKNEVSRGLKAFMSARRVKVNELAYVLGINSDHLNGIIRGTAELNVDDLSKILVALDLAVEIKPVGETPLGAYGEGMPLGGPMPRRGEKLGRERRHMPFGGPVPFPPMPFGEGVPFPEPFAVPAEEPQPRDERGRFTSRNAARKAPVGGEFAALSDEELKDIIVRNLWDGEINLDRASHDALAEFVERKDTLMKQRSGDVHTHEDEPMADDHIGHEEFDSEPEAFGGLHSEEKPNVVNSFLEALGNIAKAVESDPRLAETFERFMPKR